MEFPGGKIFAFSILDDTDDATVDNVRPIYSLLDELGIRTTKTVWSLESSEPSRRFFAGETLEKEGYLEFVHELVQRGVELAWHCASMESSERPRTVAAFEYFAREFGFLPEIHCNHGANRENLYWGSSRYRSWLARLAARFYSKLRANPRYSGEEPNSPFFWGDLCKEHIRFVRNYTFSDINVLNCDPHMPYRLPTTPYVQYWFSTSDAANVREFNRLVTTENLDRLGRENGVCIISTHLGKGFVRNGKVNPYTERMLRELSERGAWTAPVSEILTFLLEQNRGNELPPKQQLGLEYRHLVDRIKCHLSTRRAD